MAKEDAQISVGADVSAAEAAAGKVKQHFRDAASDMASEMGRAAQEVVGSFTRVATSMAHVDFSRMHVDVRSFEDSTARLAVATGRDLESVRASMERTGTAINKRPQEVAAWAASVGELTESFSDAQDSMVGVAQLAATTGRDMQSYQGVAVQLGQVGVAGKDSADALAAMVAQAQALHEPAGAVVDQFAAAGEAVTRFTDRGIDGIKHMTAFLGMMGEGLDKASRERVGAEALGALQSDPRGWERYLHRHIIDDKTGKIEDPGSVYRDIYHKTARRFHGEDLRNVLINNFGAELGTSILRHGKAGDFDKKGFDLGKLGPSALPGEALALQKDSDAGRRQAAEVELAKSARDLMGSSSLLGKAADALQTFAAQHPVASNAIASATSAASGFGLASIGKWATGLIRGGSAGASATAEGAAGAGVAGAVLGVAGSAAAGGYAGYRLGRRLFMERDTAGNYDLAEADAETARLKKIRDQKRAEKGWAPVGVGAGTRQPAQVVAKIEEHSLEQAVTRGLAQAQVTIVNATGGPIDAVVTNSSSGAAGNQL